MASKGINFGFKKTLPIVFQTEAAECGLACLVMVAGYYGHNVELRQLRHRYSISLKGMSLDQLIRVAKRLNLNSRPIRLELDDLRQLKLPCVLHWGMNHFVVLQAVQKNQITIHDPSRGRRVVALSEVSNQFTGIALELEPGADFSIQAPPIPLRLRQLMGRVVGMKRTLVQILLLAGILEVFSVTSPLFMQWITDHVLVSSDRDLLTTLTLAFLLFLIVQQIVSAARSWALIYIGTTIGMQWKTNVFSHLLRLPITYFEKRSLGDIASRFGTVESIQQTLTGSFLAAILDGVMSVVTLVLMLLYSVKLGVIAIFAMLIYGVSRWVWYKPLRAATEESIVKSANAQSHFLETLRGIRAIQFLRRSNERQTSWANLLVEQINANLTTAKIRLGYQQWNGVLFGIEGIVIIWFGANMVMAGEFTIGMLLAFNAYKGQFNSRVAALIDNYYEVKMLRIQGERLADIVLTVPEDVDSDREDYQNNSCISGRLTLDGVDYRYAHGEPTIINRVSFDILPGQSVALVGATGCGKSTLMKLMLGALKPTQGKVEIDGTDLRILGLDRYRRDIATVMQDDTLFSGSISENICFFANNPDHDFVVECAKSTCIHDEIIAMPMGYNTLIGELGTVLSGGQKQRVLLARAIYKKPRILFLDEATCHLDVNREREVVESIKALQITRIFIAHRPDTIASADRVVRLIGGKLQEEQV